MNDSTTSDTSKTSSHIEVIQSLFEEILQIQNESKQTDESIIRIQEIILESSRVVENSKSANEMIVDAKILQTGTNCISTNVNSLNTNLTSFSESKYISGLLTYLENSPPAVPPGKEWACFARVTYQMFKKSHPMTYMLGTFTLEPPTAKNKVKGEKKQLRKVPEIEKKVLSEVAEKDTSVESESDIYDHILKYLVKQHKKNDRNPIQYFSFIIDPTSYWRTVENIFHFAFLVRDGSAKMTIKDGLPYVEPILKNLEERVDRKPCNNQFCLKLGVKEWRDCIERFHIYFPTIPPFVKKS